MKIGLIARMDKTGLGVQTKELFDHFKPHKTLVIDSIPIKEGNPKQHPEWFPEDHGEVRIESGWIHEDGMNWLTDDVDIIFTVETFYNFSIIDKAREKGVKTVMQYNAEFLVYFDQYMYSRLPWPDVLLAPTEWMIDRVIQVARGQSEVKYLPMPVNRQSVPFKLRGQSELLTFLHIAGKKTHMDRNGTEIFLKAIPHVKSPVKFILHTQEEPPHMKDKRLTVKTEVENYVDLYKEGDIFVLPRKYAGLCLPLNEAMSSGMIPVMTNCQPQDLFLGKINKLCLVPWSGRKVLHTKTQVDVFEVDPLVLAERIDMIASLPRETIGQFSQATDEFVEGWSWDNMLGEYMKLFEGIIK